MHELPPNDFNQLTLTDIMRFIRGIGIEDAPCSTCKSNEWFIEGARQHTYVDLFLRNSQTEKSADLIAGQLGGSIYTLPCVSMICANCGYIKLHYKPVILNWLQKNPKELNITEDNK